ncbi:DNA replication/repair protein RecF [Frigoriflavimonas asaccharolytica]|uniref:DNA replication and repair protein RecF n=1 Tax=Frigoriflavimonas asaccharolytica TaxID=2735899 RepID=A0A8J8G518_9FLAO|nr:DNA replication/repair protein RecF [Frigoriflavimonas asaccharolytica]NRS91268.1 DNA replication and repair protein RecF [Frigoriflavimonas asaccharolytica]
MFILKLSLLNFKNHTERHFEFSPEINCFVGNNGVGKTNVLDALHYLSVGKSFLGNTDANNIASGEDFFSIEAGISTEEKDSIIKIILPRDAKKLIKKNDKSYDRISDHIGFLPSVIISPYDSNLITDSGESRRKFLDSMISQTDSTYLYSLIQYQKIIKQRNALLKYFSKNRTYDANALEIYNQPLTKFGAEIYTKRSNFITQLLPIIQQYYEIISNGIEKINVGYETQLHTENSDEVETRFLALLNQNNSRDRMLTYTSTGIHKDDLLFTMNEIPIKKIGSQGQQKSFLIALKLAQMIVMKNLTGKTPLLLLDDIFDKLDDSRVSQLVKLVNQEHFGQIFITDTNRERTENVVKRINEESRIFEL